MPVPAWLVWLTIALALGAAEVLTATLDLVLLAVAAGVAAAVAGAGLGLGFQFAAFAVSAVLLLLVVRPVVRGRLVKGPPIRDNVAALVGCEAVTLSEVNREAGLVRIKGETWTARPYDASQVIPRGATVDVFAIDGATALVHPQEEPWPN
jgi:membrane protein implicated in regulation of membrane protease activity